MNLQSIFNTAYLGIFAQGGPSVQYEAGYPRSCYYWSLTGEKCPVGHLIPESEYDPSIELNSIDKLKEQNRLPPSLTGLSKRTYSFLKQLQSAHDQIALSSEEFFPAFHSAMQKLAKKYKLTIPNLQDNI